MRIFIADDDVLVRSSFCRLVRREFSVEGVLVGEASTGISAFVELRVREYDLAFIDIGLPELNGYLLIKKLAFEKPKLPTVVYTGRESICLLNRCLRAGTRGILMKPLPFDIRQIISSVSLGQFYSNGFAQENFKQISQFSEMPTPLSQRELEVLQLFSEGHSYFSIACKMEIKMRTVSFHLDNIRKKLKLFDKADLTRYALQHSITFLDLEV